VPYCQKFGNFAHWERLWYLRNVRGPKDVIAQLSKTEKKEKKIKLLILLDITHIIKFSKFIVIQL